MPEIYRTKSRTDFEYLCERLMGPGRLGSDDTVYYPCPVCGSERKCHITPITKEYTKQRLHCFKCQLGRGRGWDEGDLTKFFYRELGWPRRRAMIEEWEKQWRSQQESNGLVVNSARGNAEGKMQLTEREQNYVLYLLFKEAGWL